MNDIFEVCTKNINGDKSQTIKINGKDIDLNDPKDINKAIEYFESCKNNHKPVSSIFKLFDIDLSDIYNKAIDVLEAKKHDLLRIESQKEEEDIWGELGIDDTPNNNRAYEYLCKTHEGFEELPYDVQAKHIKTVSDILDWADDK